MDDTTLKLIIERAEQQGHPLTNEQKAMLRMPSSTENIQCYAWMEEHFDLIGDKVSNKNGEIHIEPCEMVSVWEEYVDDYKNSINGIVSLEVFYDIWKKCFPYVKIREFKAVTGTYELYCKNVSLISYLFLFHSRKMPDVCYFDSFMKAKKV